MAHDLLAPLVLQRFRISVAPGQRARHLLENRVPEWAEGKTGPVDRADLASVMHGASGMRALTADEDRLVAVSREEDERLMAEEAEEARRLREAEEGRLKAKAQARQKPRHASKNRPGPTGSSRKPMTGRSGPTPICVAGPSRWPRRWGDVDPRRDCSGAKQDADKQRDLAEDNLDKFFNEANDAAASQAEQLRSANGRPWTTSWSPSVQQGCDKRVKAMRSSPG